MPFGSAPGEFFNFGNPAYLQQPSTRYTAGFNAHYEISKMADVYTNFMFDDISGQTQLSPSAVFQLCRSGQYPGHEFAGLQSGELLQSADDGAGKRYSLRRHPADDAL